MTLEPHLDGVTHLNVYSQAQTELGRRLSNFALSPIDTEDGKFNSIEGYWYWLGVAPGTSKRDSLRSRWGYEAKKLGRELRGSDYQEDSEEFRRKIKEAIKIKLGNDDELRAMLKANTLPLVHYYVYNGKVVAPNEGKWVIDFISEYAKIN